MDGHRADPGDRHGTRGRIQAVALELFTNHGYEKTSLREISEHLGVTKAALYYHFKSKEDIVASLLADYFAHIDELIAWGQSQPRTKQTRREVLTRYFGIVTESGNVFRMLQQNQAAIERTGESKRRGEQFEQQMNSLVGILCGPDAPLATQIRAASAVVSVSFGCMFYAERASSPAELRDAVLGVAFELTDKQDADPR